MVRVSFVLATTIGCGLLTACAVQPAYPLLTPIQLAHNFGYAERPVDDTHWVVSYVSPEEQGHSSRFSNPPLGAHAKAMAFDLALWHASQIALARGYTGFSVVDRHFNTDAYETADYPHDPYWYGGFRAHSEEGFFGRFGWGGAWSSELSPSPDSNVQVEAQLKIVLTNEPKNADDFRATDTINRLRATYPAADALPLHPAA
jgi:hypothetical protein